MQTTVLHQRNHSKKNKFSKKQTKQNGGKSCRYYCVTQQWWCFNDQRDPIHTRTWLGDSGVRRQWRLKGNVECLPIPFSFYSKFQIHWHSNLLQQSWRHFETRRQNNHSSRMIYTASLTFYHVHTRGEKSLKVRINSGVILLSTFSEWINTQWYLIH